MRLSDLKTGEQGIITKVLGHGGFRKRIVEMGFVKGKAVEVLLNAPLQDPVKYKIMGYEVSLRHSEAENIEVVSEEEAQNLFFRQKEKENELFSKDNNDSIDREFTEEVFQTIIDRQKRTINVALVGNPNCGKTSLFNFVSGAHERVGNYSGVTVDAKEGYAEFEDYHFNIVDLPGTYSLSAYSPEELYVRKQIIDKTPDVIINVIDSSNLERNLYLTTQLVDMHLRMVAALNMYDETQKRGDKLNTGKLSELFGIPMVPTVFTSGKGVKELFRQIIRLYETDEDQEATYRHIHINHGHEVEHGISEIQQHLKTNESVRLKYSTRYLGIKLLENDKDIEQLIHTLPNQSEIFQARNKAAARIKEETNEDCETAVMDAKYGFIHGALREAGYELGEKNDVYHATRWIDSIVTNKYVGFPLFFFMMWLMFEATFSLGQYPMDWIESAVAWLGEAISANMPEGPLKAMLTDGIIGGVGAVIVFLPQILILYFFISFMEDSGYMARAAFIMDRVMHKMGVHGKSFIPLIMGFGCNVPAVMATRTIESRKSRLITMLILPLMSCSARLPIYIMIIGTFFAVEYRSTVMMSLYIVGILLAFVMSRVLARFVVKGEDAPFVMELPPYRMPTWKAMGRHTWEKAKQYLKKMGGIILVASIIVWALGYFPHSDQMSTQEQQRQSYIGRIGHALEPIFAPQGFNWKLDVGIVAGMGAKEIVASTMGVLYTNDDSFADDNTYAENGDKYHQLHRIMEQDGITPLTAYSFLLFILLYFPCVATIAAIKGETGSWRWASFAAIYTTALAWVVSAGFYQIGSLLGF